jgi:hypothetical protein
MGNGVSASTGNPGHDGSLRYRATGKPTSLQAVAIGPEGGALPPVQPAPPSLVPRPELVVARYLA